MDFSFDPVKVVGGPTCTRKYDVHQRPLYVLKFRPLLGVEDSVSPVLPW